MHTSFTVKLLIVLGLLAILVSLGSALFALVRDKGRSQRTVRALTWRIGLSLGLFVLLLLGIATGVVVPHDIGG